MLQQSNHTVKSALEKIRCDGISKGRETCTCFLMEKPYWGKLGLYVRLFYHYHGCVVASFPGFPVHHPVFDRLQYAKMEGGGLVRFIT